MVTRIMANHFWLSLNTVPFFKMEIIYFLSKPRFFVQSTKHTEIFKKPTKHGFIKFINKHVANKPKNNLVNSINFDFFIYKKIHGNA